LDNYNSFNEFNKKDIIEQYSFPDINMEQHLDINQNNKKDNAFQHIYNGVKTDEINFMSAGSYADSGSVERTVDEDSYDRGFSEGKKAGSESEKKLAAVIKNFQQSLIDLEKAKKEMILNAEKGAVELALAVAKKIICHEVSINKSIIVDIVKEALKKILDYNNIKIKVGPSDYEFINKSKGEFSDFSKTAGNMVFEQDESILDGGCLIETDSGHIDARIENQLQIIEDGFRTEYDKKT